MLEFASSVKGEMITVRPSNIHTCECVLESHPSAPHGPVERKHESVTKRQ